MDSSVYCLPADLLGEGAERVVGTVRDRAGGPGVTVAACYHASRDILPHNPAYRVASLAPGAFYAVDPSAYPGRLRPAASPSAAGRDILAEACQAAAPLGVQVSAWAVFLHRDDLDDRAPGVQENCFGDRFPGRLCPASPVVGDYALGMIRELCRYPIAALRAEALHYQGAAHGHHHERGSGGSPDRGPNGPAATIPHQPRAAAPGTLTSTGSASPPAEPLPPARRPAALVNP
jgi:hypothetical protein